ncbi:DNA primase [Candidatus Woesearchaeota archaeon]|nr:DNA primase [Candidatus Woesearchaeota archaeon]
MGKISQVASKYIVHASIFIEGVVDRPDVIGAIFGQTEGLLGEELELRELQRSGRIGRIEVNVDTRKGQTKGNIILPSSLDKAETAIIAAAMEIIQRIGPCNAKIKVENIEDVRVSKRNFVVSRAKELLKNLLETSMPDSQELADEVAHSVRVMEMITYGKDRLSAGPAIDDSDEVIIVEGRADVVNMLKHGIKNAIAVNGTSIPQTIIELSKRKSVTAFVDGDRGGDLIIKELAAVADMDYVTKAPDGKEVEELTKKEIHKALRSRISMEQARHEFGLAKREDGPSEEKRELLETRQGNVQGNMPQNMPPNMPPHMQQQRRTSSPVQPAPNAIPRASPLSQPMPLRREERVPVPGGASAPMASPPQAAKQHKLQANEKTRFNELFEDLIGTKGAYLLDEKLSILGKVPLTELPVTMKSLGTGVYAIVFDGSIEKKIVEAAEQANVNFLVGMDTKVRQNETPVSLVAVSEL